MFKNFSKKQLTLIRLIKSIYLTNDETILLKLFIQLSKISFLPYSITMLKNMTMFKTYMVEHCKKLLKDVNK